MKNTNILLIPHYNNPDGLMESIKSIGSKEKLDIVIIDDGSNDKPDVMSIKQKQSYEGKLVFLYLEENKGIETALNTGIEYAMSKGYKYISRLDCGDLCQPDRFKIQEEYLDKNPQVSIVGSAVRFFYGNDTKFIKRFPINNKQIQRGKFINSPFSHPAVMIRSSAIEKVGGYSLNYHRAEDYELFFRILKITEGYNYKQYLVHSELNPNGISLLNRKQQLLTRLKIQINNLAIYNPFSYLGVVISLIMIVLPYGFVEILKKKLFK